MAKNISSTKLVCISLVVGLLAGMFGGVITNRYVVAYVLGTFVTDRSIDEPVVQKVVESRTYVEESDGIEAINKMSGSVVSIVATRDLNIYYQNSYPLGWNGYLEQANVNAAPDEVRKQKLGGGTGFIITNDGLVLTNRHVVDVAGIDYTVVLKDGTEFKAEVVSQDPFYDIAVMRMLVDQDESPEIKEKKEAMLGTLPVVRFGDSDVLQVGQKVFAVGNALAQYDNTVTSGIISAKGRNVIAGGASSGPEALTGLIQTDAAINPGNSGGPLINLDGEVIGVNVAIDEVAQSVGFAIPINDIKPILTSIQKYGKIVRPVLGVRYLSLNTEIAKELNLAVGHGALLVGNQDAGVFAVAPGGPAAAVGLQRGDVILEIDGIKLDRDYSLQNGIQFKQPGELIKIKYWRAGETFDVELTLGQQEV